MKQIISKGGVVYCETTVPYPPETVAKMKKAGYKVGYKVKNVEEDEKDEN